MRITQSPVDTEILGRPLVELTDVSSATDLASEEREWVSEYRPLVAVVRIPAEDLRVVHACEDLGFRFSECQLELRRRITARFPVTTTDFEHFQVRDERDLEDVLELAGEIFAHDRFSLDPAFGPEMSRQRYRAFVRRSFLAPDEIVLALRDRETDRIVGFSTERRLSATEMRALLGGVAARFQRTGLALLNDYLGSNFNHDLGVRAVTTAISSIHHAVMHVHLRHMGYRVTKTWAILTKVYA